MKIGILTLPFNNNYGGYLQAFALQKTLEQMGNEVEILHKRFPHKSPWYRAALYPLYSLFRAIRIGYIIPKDIYKHQGKKMLKFVSKYMHLTPMIFTDEELYAYCNKQNYDAIVVGSDQLWRPRYVPNIQNYFLCFADKKVKKIAYAASFGTQDVTFNEEDAEKCGDSLEEFTGVGLRETEGLDILKRFGWTNESIEVVLDPTMLLTRDYYESLINKSLVHRNFQGKIATYILDINEDIESMLDVLERKHNKAIEHILDLKKWKRADYVMPSIEEWLLAIHDADVVLTDSFHGTVFSILFHKPFVTVINQKRGADRFNTLLGHFNLQNRIANDTSEVEKIISKSINWNEVDERMNALRQHSISFLSKSLQ